MSLRGLYDVPAPAKLNLFLHIVGRRDDGYHLLESVFVLIDWADTLHFELRTDGQLVRHDLGPALPADDLCLRAARALQSAGGTGLGVDISIDKKLPWGAGMGGGSSDAATTLLALNRLWGLNFSRQRLARIGLQLGADVPFFVAGQNAFVQGIGEQLMPLTLQPSHFVVVKPPQNIATQDIFSHPALVRNTAKVNPAAILAGSFEGGPSWKNDLQSPAEEACPEVAHAALWLQARYGNSRMTGSGSAVFSRVSADLPAVESQVEAQHQLLTGFHGSGAPPLATLSAGGPLRGLPSGWVGRMCCSLPQHPLLGWAD